MSNSHDSVRSDEPGWVEVVEISPVPTLQVTGTGDAGDPGRITAANDRLFRAAVEALYAAKASAKGIIYVQTA